MNYLAMLTESSIFRYVLMTVSGAMAIFFVVAFASLLYHWHYYGIGFFRRWVLIAVFGGVGLALVIASYGLMIKLT